MGSIPNTIDNFFTNAEAKSYFKDGLAYMRDKLIELELTTENILVLFEGEVQVEFPTFPTAFIWVWVIRQGKWTKRNTKSGLALPIAKRQSSSMRDCVFKLWYNLSRSILFLFRQKMFIFAQHFFFW